jgi:hypothetical protein
MRDIYIKIAVFWDVTPYSLVNRYQRFRGTCCFCLQGRRVNCAENKKFWEELIVCFPLIRHRPHRIRCLQQLFVATGTSLPSCYPATIGAHTDRPTDSPLIRRGDRIENYTSNSSSIVACIRCPENVFTELLPSNDRGDAYTDTQTNGRDLWSMPLRKIPLPWYMYQVS